MDKNDLQKYARLKQRLQDLEYEIQELDNQIHSARISRLTHEARSSAPFTQEDRTIKFIELQEVYKDEWINAMDFKIEVERAISSMYDPLERRVLSLRYGEGLSWSNVAKKLGYAESHIKTTLHAKAVKNFEIETYHFQSIEDPGTASKCV